MLSAWIAECNLPTIGNICVLGSLLIFRAAHKASPVKHFRADLTDAEVPEVPVYSNTHVKEGRSIRRSGRLFCMGRVAIPSADSD